VREEIVPEKSEVRLTKLQDMPSGEMTNLSRLEVAEEKMMNLPPRNLTAVNEFAVLTESLGSCCCTQETPSVDVSTDDCFDSNGLTATKTPLPNATDLIWVNTGLE